MSEMCLNEINTIQMIAMGTILGGLSLAQANIKVANYLIIFSWSF